jgi:AcrR family transcriptional regulator
MTMRKKRKDAQQTRQRLLAAAAEVFADKGFWEATHAQICKKAKTNTAAVNYHFGSKENLYVEAWKHAFDRSVHAHPLDGGIAADAPVQDRLYGRILAFMHRIADPNNREVEIVHKEMANPTGLLGETMRQTMEPMRRDMRNLVQELLGNGADEQQCRFCEMSIISQCFGPMLHLRRIKKRAGAPLPGGPPMQFAVEDLADHIMRFSLVGIRGIRKESQKKTGGRKPRRGGLASKRR